MDILHTITIVVMILANAVVALSLLGFLFGVPALMIGRAMLRQVAKLKPQRN